MTGVTYDSIKRHKKTGFHAFSEKHIFEKTKDGGRGEGGGLVVMLQIAKK